MTLERHDAFGRPLSEEEARRRAQAVTLGRYEDDRWRWRIANRRWRRRAAATFMALAIVSSISAYLSYAAGRDSASGLRENARAASLSNCNGGGDLRVVIADGLDQLRRLAVSGNPRAPRALIVRFFQQTQPAIDELLTQAAYGRDAVRRYHVHAPLGEVTAAVEREVQALSVERCARRTARLYDG